MVLPALSVRSADVCICIQNAGTDLGYAHPIGSSVLGYVQTDWSTDLRYAVTSIVGDYHPEADRSPGQQRPRPRNLHHISSTTCGNGRSCLVFDFAAEVPAGGT
eukprot:2662687-Rhodomonas_salina.1